jgi:cytochrome c5
MRRKRTRFCLAAIAWLAPAVAWSASGQEIYDAACKACHETGVSNAPRVGDKAGWAPLIKEGLTELTADAIKGKGAMPPKGGRPELTRNDISRAIVYMANRSGARWKDPPGK